MCAIAAAPALFYFFFTPPDDQDPSKRWMALVAGFLFGLPALVGLAGILLGPQVMERARGWLAPLFTGIWFLIFGGLLIFGALFQSKQFSGGLPFLPAALNKQIGSGAFFIVGALIALLGFLSLWAGLRRWLRSSNDR